MSSALSLVGSCLGIANAASARHAYLELSRFEEEARMKQGAQALKIAWAEAPTPAPPPPRRCQADKICLDHNCLLLGYQVCKQCISTLDTRDRCCEADFMKDSALLAAHASNDLDAWTARLKHKPDCLTLRVMFCDQSKFSAETIKTVLDNNYYTYPLFRLDIIRMRSHFLSILRTHASELEESKKELSSYTDQLARAEAWLTTAPTHVVTITKALCTAFQELIPSLPTTMDSDLRAAIYTDLVSLHGSGHTVPASLKAKLAYYAQAINFMKNGAWNLQPGEGYRMPSRDILPDIVLPPSHWPYAPHQLHSIPQIRALIDRHTSTISRIGQFSDIITPLLDAVKEKFGL